jgi:predicted dehydrogenase
MLKGQKKDSRVGFAVVGLGSIAQSSVLPAFARTKKAMLVALVSSDKEKAARLARTYKEVASYSQKDYSACLANPAVDAIYIATPQGEHAALTIQAARAGKHVLCEKPLAATIQQSASMVRACRQNEVLLMTAYRKYFEPSTLFLKRLIQNGELGRIDTIHTSFSELHMPGTSLAWLLDAKLAGGGPLMDLGIYCINTSRWLVNEDPVEVGAESWKNDAARFRQVEEGITFRMRFPSGLVVQGSSSYGAVMSSFIYIQGAKGWVCVTPVFDFNEERRLTGTINGRSIQKSFPVTDEFAPELDAFASAILKKTDIAPDGVQGHRDMIILRSIYEAARRGKRVKIRYT